MTEPTESTPASDAQRPGRQEAETAPAGAPAQAPPETSSRSTGSTASGADEAGADAAERDSAEVITDLGDASAEQAPEGELDVAADQGGAEPGTAEPTPEPAAAEEPAATAERDTAEPAPEPSAESDATADDAVEAPAAAPAPKGPRPHPKPGKASKPGSAPGKDGGRPRGTPRPPARPPTGSPADAKPVPRPPQALATPAPPAVHDAQEAAQAAQWGRVDDDGTVWVREAAGERAVGQYPEASAKEALAYYVVRFLDLQAQVTLLETRLPQLAVKEIDQTITALETATAEPAAVGDLDGLRERLRALREAAKERRDQLAAEREAAKAEATTARRAIVEQAEELAAADPERTQWRPAGERLRALLEEWKEAQRHGPRIDKPIEDELWHRFSQARAAFDKTRRQHFAELERRRSEARSAKESLIEAAEKLSTSTDWSATATEFRSLMDRWKAVGRAAPREDDALWERFRAAQDAFFAARNAAGAAAEEEFAGNLRLKLDLLTEAEALLPIKDMNKARTALRSIQERWEAIGKVPRGDVQQVEGRLRAVEQAVRDAQQTQWTRGNPETRARAEGVLAQLEATIASLEADLEAARAKGDARSVKAAKEALAVRQSWLTQLRRTADDVAQPHSGRPR